jgi:hypothetical protein
MSPFFADLGYNPAMRINLDVRAAPTSEAKAATKFLLHMEAILRQLQAQVRVSAEQMKLQYDKGRRDQTFQVGDMVLVSTKTLSVQRRGSSRRDELVLTKSWKTFTEARRIG